MKKFLALLFTAVLLTGLCACNSNPYKNDSKEDFSKKAESGEYGSFVCFYSSKNEDRSDDEMWVMLSSAEEESPLYSSDGTLVQLVNGKNLYDENGEKINEDSLEIGDTLIVSYNLKTYSDSPVTVKAYKVEKMAMEAAQQS